MYETAVHLFSIDNNSFSLRNNYFNSSQMCARVFKLLILYETRHDIKIYSDTRCF